MEPIRTSRLLGFALCANCLAAGPESTPQPAEGVVAAAQEVCDPGGDNCQSGVGTDAFHFVAASGPYIANLTFVVAADDFIPLGDTLSAICVQGWYENWDRSAPNPDCAATTLDEFRVRVYANDPATHAPGALVASRVARNELRIPAGNAWLDVYNVRLEFDPIAVTPGECHWLEVYNRPWDSWAPWATCDWYWVTRRSVATERNGNNYSVAGNRLGWTPMTTDLAFCLDIPFEEGGCGGPPSGTCCSCADGTCEVTFPDDCRFHGDSYQWDPAYGDCAQLNCAAGPPTGDVGQTVGDSCPNGGTCVGGATPGQPCAAAADCPPDGGCNCAPNGPILLPSSDNYHALDIAFSNRCADTGPFYPLSCEALIECPLQAEVWFRYVVGLPGELTIGTCATVSSWNGGFDSMVAVYHDADNPTVCAYPPSYDLLWPAGLASDEQCHAFTHLGGGLLRGHRAVYSGDCFLIRVGGYEGEQGRGTLSVSLVPKECSGDSLTVEPERIPGPGGGPTVSTMNRFLAFQVTTTGRRSLLRITPRNLPPPWDVWNDRGMYIASMRQICESAAIGEGQQCPTGVARFWVARLSCSLPEQGRDWSTYGTIYVQNPVIVPGGTYEIDALDEDPYCWFGGPPGLTIRTPRWGDAVGTFRSADNSWTPPDGGVGITTDVTALLSKFGNRTGAPNKVRADLEPLFTDLRINITDVTRCIDAFRGLPFPFASTGIDPCAAGE